MLKDALTVRSKTLIVGVEGMSWPKTGANHYHAQQGFSDKGCSIKRVGCLLYSIGSMKRMSCRTWVRCAG